MSNWGFFRKENRVLLYELVKTDFKLRYQGSLLGVIWSVLKPLMIFFVMYQVFVNFLRFTDGTPTYPLVLLLGISLWGFFTEATQVGMESIVGRGDIIRKINIPKYIIIFSSMTGSLISLSINLIVVIMAAIITGVDFGWSVLMVPLNVLQLFVLAFGVSLLLSTLYVKFRDIKHIYDVVVQILFYSMPIIYPLQMVSKIKVFGMNAQDVLMLNPIAQSIQDVRHNLIAPATTPTTWSVIDNFWIRAVPIVLTVIIFTVGVIYFKSNSDKFAETI